MKLFTLLLMLLVTSTAYTEEVHMYELFNVVLGEKYNCAKCDHITLRRDRPSQSFKAPLNDAELNVFYDFTVRVSTDSEKVAKIVAERYFEDSAECGVALDKVKSYLVSRYGLSQSNYPAVWERVSDDGIIQGELSCSIAEGEPYYQLKLFFTHLKQIQIINNSLEMFRNR